MDVEPISTALESAVMRASSGGDSAALLFSGGLDSSLIAWILKRNDRAPVLLTTGLPDSHDIASGKSAAEMLSLPLQVALLSEQEVMAVSREMAVVNPLLGANDLAVQVSMALAMQRAPRSLLLCGQGADELFLGYHHVRGLTGRELVERAEADMDKLRGKDWPITEELARSLGKRILAPYLDTAFARVVERFTWEERNDPTESKRILREVAVRMGLPQGLAHRPKKAFQYGSGVFRIVKRACSPSAFYDGPRLGPERPSQ